MLFKAKKPCLEKHRPSTKCPVLTPDFKALCACVSVRTLSAADRRADCRGAMSHSLRSYETCLLIGRPMSNRFSSRKELLCPCVYKYINGNVQLCIC